MPLPRVLALTLALAVFAVPQSFAQISQNSAPVRTASAIDTALIGSWAGYLEYRDYAEPETSTRRVQLPTWLTVTPSPAGLAFHYVYDDGPGKILEEADTVLLDTAAATYSEAEQGKPAQVYQVAGLTALKDGHGTLTLTGQGTDNDKPAEQRITLTLRRNLVEWLLEVRPAGSQAAFTFRHLFRFTRATPPAITAPR